MSFDFDTVPQRLGTDSQKWQKYEGQDILPMWVADMDFRASPAIIDALHRRVDHGIFGYARPTRSTIAAVVDTFQQRYGWTIDPSWIVWLPGLVCGLNITAQAFAQPGEQVLCNTPVYPPFMTAPRNSGRESLMVPLAFDASARRWEIDWDAMERSVTPRTKVFFLCNPHNPVARVFRRDELERIGEFCLRHNLVLCSDEIHCDLILENIRHTPTGSLGGEIADRTVTLMAPSKTYNIAGLGCSFAIIPDAKLRLQFVRAGAGIVPEMNPLSYAACEAAFREGEPWRQALLAYLRGNRDLIAGFLREHLPMIKLTPCEATYLAWLDVSALGLKDAGYHFEQHGLGFADGAQYGAPAGRFVRLNFGCTRATLTEALHRLQRAVAAR